MPEGPEVTIMVEEISKKFKNSILKKLTIQHSKYISKIKDIKKFTNSLPLRIKEIKNKGKFVYMILENDWSLGFTPGMTGHFWIEDFSKKYKTTEGYIYNSKYNYISLETSKGLFHFNDPRLFGHFYIYHKNQNNSLESKLKTLGPDLLKDLLKMTQISFNERLGKYNLQRVIADVLLEQNFIAGIGNYIRAEALYRAKIAPLRTIGTLNANDKKRLKKSLEEIGQESYNSQKKGLHTFVFRIYGNPVAQQIKRKGRTIWWDPKKQK